MGRDMLSIGKFSTLSRISVKALRFYDEEALLKPGYTDAKSGYRYYSSAQLSEANLIRLLRSLEFGLDDIRLFMRDQDAALRRRLLEKQRQKIEKAASNYRSIISILEGLIEGKETGMERQVEVREMADQLVLGMRFHTSLEKIEEDIGKAFTSIFSYLGEAAEYPAGPPFALYYINEDGEMGFDENDIDMEMCVPVAKLMGGKGDVGGREVPGATVVSTLHLGPYQQVTEAYQALTAFAEANGYRFVGPAREIYLVGMGQVEDEADYRTEIVIPVEKK
jgi:effector-binding domain-containing protein